MIIVFPCALGMTDEVRAQSLELKTKGKALVAALNCQGCHRTPEEQTNPGPLPGPELGFEGDRVRPEWLFDFLQQPHRVRPALHARMPNFRLSTEEALALTEFLMSLRNPALSSLVEPLKYGGRPSGEAAQAARRMAEKGALNCFLCHWQGGRQPTGPPETWAPDLTQARSRLNPDWIVRWIDNPQAINPRAIMPAYPQEGPAEFLGGDRARQLAAVRDFVYSLGSEPSAAEYRRARASYPRVTSELGKRIAEEANCAACHLIPGIERPKDKIAPPLSRVALTRDREWVERFLRDPGHFRAKGYLGGARAMPTFRLSQEEARAIAAYLVPGGS